MPNPFKAIKSLFSGRKGMSQKASVVEDEAYRTIFTLWPNGTWNFSGKYAGSAAGMDEVVQGVLLDVWALEEFYTAEENAGRALNPGMFGGLPPPMPPTWTPSERHIKRLFAKNKWDVRFMHYIVGDLASRRKIRP